MTKMTTIELCRLVAKRTEYARTAREYFDMRTRRARVLLRCLRVRLTA